MGLNSLRSLVLLSIQPFLVPLPPCLVPLAHAPLEPYEGMAWIGHIRMGPGWGLVLGVILLMVQKSGDQHLGCTKPYKYWDKLPNKLPNNCHLNVVWIQFIYAKGMFPFGLQDVLPESYLDIHVMKMSNRTCPLSPHSTWPSLLSPGACLFSSSYVWASRCAEQYEPLVGALPNTQVGDHQYDVRWTLSSSRTNLYEADEESHAGVSHQCMIAGLMFKIAMPFFFSNNHQQWTMNHQQYCNGQINHVSHLWRAYPEH